MHCVTVKVVSAPASPGEIPAHLLHQANKVFCDSALWFVGFPCYERELHVTRYTLGETELDVWLRLRDKLSVFVFVAQRVLCVCTDDRVRKGMIAALWLASCVL